MIRRPSVDPQAKGSPGLIFAVLRDHRVTMAHDLHLEGLFSEADRQRLLGNAGFAVETIGPP